MKPQTAVGKLTGNDLSVAQDLGKALREAPETRQALGGFANARFGPR